LGVVGEEVVDGAVLGVVPVDVGVVPVDVGVVLVDVGVVSSVELFCLDFLRKDLFEKLLD